MAHLKFLRHSTPGRITNPTAKPQANDDDDYPRPQPLEQSWLSIYKLPSNIVTSQLGPDPPSFELLFNDPRTNAVRM